MIHVGIDPGLDGAIAAIRGSEVLLLADLPSFKVTRGREPDVGGYFELVSQVTGGFGEIRYALERQAARPGQGGSSMFKLGIGFGAWRGILATLGRPVELVRPQVWQRCHQIPPRAGKTAAFERARMLFPNAELRGPKCGILDGRSDALLIAEWLRRVS